MRGMIIIYIFMVLFLREGWVIADDKVSAKQISCENGLDISALPPYAHSLKENLPSLEDYFTCEAAVKENIQVCNAFSDGSSQKANCQDAYNKYYATFGKLYKNGRISDEFLNACLKTFRSREACDQFGEVMLSGNSEDCKRIEGATSENIALCQDMVSSDPSGGKAFLMKLLRRGDPNSCDQLNPSTVAAICRGLLTKKVDGCQLNAGVDHFKKLYCQYLATKEPVDATKKEK